MMRIRKGPFLALILLLVARAPLAAANLDGSTPEVGNAEAKRLYDEANDYVTNVSEGSYSYAYMQFYWRRAESFVERVERVYADSPTARLLKSGDLKLGPYSLDYFRNRVLPRLEIKRISAYDPVNCAIFLYEREPTRTDEAHRRAFEDIIEVMSRQARWGEVLTFNAKGDQSPTDLLRVAFREAVRSPTDQHAVIQQLLSAEPPAVQAQAQFAESQAEAYALLGTPRTALAAFLGRHPGDSVKIAALRGMAFRDREIRLRAALRIPMGDQIQTEHAFLLNLKVRDDVESVARQFWPAGHLPAEAETLLEAHRAGLGEKPAASAPLSVHFAYLDYLEAFERYDDLEAYAGSLDLDAAGRRKLALEMIELYSRAGRRADADRWAGPLRASGGEDADLAGLAAFRGRLASPTDPIIVRPDTFARLPIQDPCLLAQAVMEWSLAPERSLRGMAPWDAVVLKYLPGFDHLPLPTSEDLRRAAAATQPF